MAYPEMYPQCEGPDGCTVMRTGYGHQDMIAFCSRHKAAPEMYEALKEWSVLDEIVKECPNCEAVEFGLCSSHVFQLGQIYKMREAALAKAEGRKV